MSIVRRSRPVLSLPEAGHHSPFPGGNTGPRALLMRRMFGISAAPGNAAPSGGVFLSPPEQPPPIIKEPDP